MDDPNHDVYFVRDEDHNLCIAVRVTKDRLWEVTKWCNGRLTRTFDRYKDPITFIYMGFRKTRTFASTGDWILLHEDQFTTRSNSEMMSLLESKQDFHHMRWMDTGPNGALYPKETDVSPQYKD